MKHLKIFGIIAATAGLFACGSSSDSQNDAFSMNGCECANEIHIKGINSPNYAKCMELKEQDKDFDYEYTKCTFALKTGRDTSEVNLPRQDENPVVLNLLPGKYIINLDESQLTWKGRKKITKDSHSGTIGFKSFDLRVGDNGTATGSIIMDMSTISATNMDEEDATKLIGHLKSEDFFNVSEFPTASFEIKESEIVKNRLVARGRLTIKGKPVGQLIAMEITINEDASFSGKGSFKFDRSLYDVRYGSESFFDNLGDKVIDDNIFISFNINGTIQPSEGV